MKGITKDHESIPKDYESLFYSMKDECKNFSHNISSHGFQFPSIGLEYLALMILWRYLNCLIKPPTFRILFRKCPTVTSALTISRYDVVFMCRVCLV